jgi:hypothetical protein
MMLPKLATIDRKLAIWAGERPGESLASSMDCIAKNATLALRSTVFWRRKDSVLLQTRGAKQSSKTYKENELLPLFIHRSYEFSPSSFVKEIINPYFVY